MTKWEVIKNLNFKQIRALFVWFLKHPIFMLATLKATVNTISIAQKEFPDIHGRHNKANAFRHAIWNILIAKECFRFTSNINKVLYWTEKITDWHEDFSPNEKMPKLMDLHNNRIGRNRFLALRNKSKKEIVKSLLLELKDAVKINLKSKVKEIDKLVFLEN